MPADSIRETLLAAIHDRLAGIIGDASYHYGHILRRVERYVHTYDGTQHETQMRADAPSISVRALSESGRLGGEDVAVEQGNIQLTVDCWFALKDLASDRDLNRAIADMKKALFAEWDSWAGIATDVSWEINLVDPETGAPVDGAHLNLEIAYSETRGDPTT